MYCIQPDHCIVYDSFLHDIRSFFKAQGFIAVETPLLNPTGSVEAHLDSFQVLRNSARKSPAPTAAANEKYAGYLITSPEYRLKTLLSQLRCNIYQIAHCFRAGEIGPLHLEEFLMLEWYLVGADEFTLMDQCEQLLRFLIGQPYSRRKAELTPDFSRRSIRTVLQEYAGCSWERAALEQRFLELQVPGHHSWKEMSYSDLFFTVFLNLVEPHLGRGGPEFLYHYPPELSALSRVEKGYARRFELYWDGIELANAYYELTQKEDYQQRFAEENISRQKLNKSPMPVDQQFLASLQKEGLPECSGIALGLERLFLVLLSQRDLKEFYHYQG